MIDEKLYRETFSRLQASDEAKKEVLLKMNETKKTRRPLKALRVLALAAALTLALAVTANAASNGGLFQTLRIIWQDGSSIMMEDNLGNYITVTGVDTTKVEVRDGKLTADVADAESHYVKTGQFTMESSDGTEVKINITEESPVGVEVDTVEGAIYSVNVDSGTAEVSYSRNTESDTAAESPAAEDTTTYTVVTAND